MRPILHQLEDKHPDYPVLSSLRDEIATRTGGLPTLQARFPELVREAVAFLLNPVRTARTKVSELDNVEKTFIGLKLEHFVRDMLDVPKGLRDLVVKGVDVDIKNTVGDNWSIPLETYSRSEPCLLMSINDEKCKCSLGLIIAKLEYLHGGAGNRDTKRGVSKAGFKNILWLVKDEPFPLSRFIGLDMDRFRHLRKTLKGNKRVAQFWRENLGRVLHRDVMKALLFDQDDYMKRLRKNGGAPDDLGDENIAILIGTYLAARQLADALGTSGLKADEVVALAPKTEEDWKLMRLAKVVTTDRWTG